MANKFLRDLTQCSAIAIATGMVLSGGKAQAQSFAATGTVAEGAATITTGVGTTDITVQSNSAVIDWAPDDVNGFGDILFQQAGTTATFTNGMGITDFAVLNRILPTDITRRIVFDGNVVSRIQDAMGTRTGGTVFFYTPGGIVIGANATFDVGNLGLTTSAPLTDGNGNFIVNNQVRFQQSESFGNIQIDPGARINALAEGSYVALFAPRITQAGEIQVNGQAALVGAEAGTITFSPDGLFDIEVEIGSDAGVPIEHYGSTGGPASSGAGDNHRIYLVTVAKNNAATLAIRGGSRLGFDIAQSASMDGEAIVLSAGYSITVGDIGPEAVGAGIGENSISIEDFDYGFGPGLEFTSDVLGAAIDYVNLGVGNTTLFRGDASLESGYVSGHVYDAGFGSSNLTVEGNLSLVARNPQFGSDVGQTTLNVSGGSSALIGGNLHLASNAQLDFDGNGEVTSGYAGVYVDGPGSTLSIGGNLLVSADVDISSDLTGLIARGGYADIYLGNGGALDVAGVTRLTANARAGSGADAYAGGANIGVQPGGTMVTGELAMAASARAGDSDSGNGGNAFGGSVNLNVFGAGASLEVLRGNTIGDVAAGEVRFLSSEAFGGSSSVANGGDATGGYINIYVTDGGSLLLADDPANALKIVSGAYGGATSADFSFAGSAFEGQQYLYAFNTVANFGRLAISSTVEGGSVLGGATGSSGGNATGGFGSIYFTDADVTIAFDPLVLSLIGGSGSLDGSGGHGLTTANDFHLSTNRGTLTITDGLAVSSTGVNGDGSVGESQGFNLSIGGTATTITGDVAIDASFSSVNLYSDFDTGIAGSLDIAGNVLLQSSGPRFGSDVGGANLNVSQGSQLSVTGDVSLIARASSDANGDLVVRSSGASIGAFDAGSTILVGGNLLLDAGIDLRGDQSGAIAEGGYVNIYASDGGLIDIAGLARLVTDAYGGDGAEARAGSSIVSAYRGGQIRAGEMSLSADAHGGADSGSGGGAAFAGYVSLEAYDPGSSILLTSPNLTSGLDFLSSRAFGGVGTSGSGGDAYSGNIQITAFGGATITLPDDAANPLVIRNTARGGDTGANDASGGNAQLGGIHINVNDATANLGRLQIDLNAGGGSALPLAQRTRGGDASGGYFDLYAFQSNVAIAFDEVLLKLQGGNGSSDGLGDGGAAFGGSVHVGAVRSTLNVLGNLELSGLSIGGTGRNGGFTQGPGGSLHLEDSQVSLAGNLGLATHAEGGAAIASDLGMGGTAQAGHIYVGVQDTTLDLAGNLVLGTSGKGGDALTGEGGAAHGGEAHISLRDGAVINAGTIDASSTVTGGSILAGGSGNGGSANYGRAAINLDPTFDEALGTNRPASHALINANVALASSATGGDAGELGGTGGAAYGGYNSLTAQNAGTLTLNGHLTIDSAVAGGRAPAGTGGAAFGGGSEIFNSGYVDPNTGEVFDAGDIAVSGDVFLIAQATGGAGQTGGDASGGFMGVNSRMADTTIAGTLNILGSVIGGEGLSGQSGGVGGNASGGSFQVDAFGLEPDPEATTISIGNLTASLVVEGGKGGAANGAGDGGRGGDAQGYGGLVFGRASKGTLSISGATAIEFSTAGGEGGAGANGGMGGNSSGGSLQLGTASGGSVPGAVNGSASFTDVSISMTNSGGLGGAATSGTGGAGGMGQGGFVGILSRGAPIHANNVNVAIEGVGGNGGTGAAMGTGGDGTGGFLSFLATQAFENPGRGTTTIGSLQMRSQGIGGTGANPGQGLHGAGGTFQVSQADVQIGSVDIDVIGGGAPASPFAFTLSNGTLISNEIVGNFSGNVQLQVIGSTLTTGVFDLAAAGFVLPAIDPTAPPVQGVIEASGLLRLTSLAGDVATRARLNGAEIVIDAAGSALLGDLSAPLVNIAANGGTIGFTAITGGAIDLHAADTITFGTVAADTLVAQSLGGDILSPAILNIAGVLDLDAGGTIDLGDVNAGQLAARTQSGGITLSGATSVTGGIALDSALGIATSGPLAAASLTAAARGGDIVFGAPVNVTGLIDLNATGLIRFAQTIAGSIVAVSGEGDILADEALDVDGALSLDTAGAITLAGVSGGSLAATSRGGDITLTSSADIAGTIALNSAGNIQSAAITAQSIDLAALSGGIDTGMLTATGTVSIATRDTILLNAITAQSLTAQSSAGDIVASQPLALTGTLDLAASGAIELSDVNAGALTARTQAGGITLSGAVEVTNALLLESALGIAAGPVTAGSLDATTSGGAIALSGPLDVSGTIDLDSSGAISLASVNAGSLAAIARSGDLVSSGAITASGAVAVEASGAVQLANVSASSIATRSGGATRITGEWNSASVNVTAPALAITEQGMVTGGADSVLVLNSTNSGGILFTQTNPGDFSGLVIDGAMFGKLRTEKVRIASAATGSAGAITIGDFDLSANTAFKTLEFANGPSETIRVAGNVTSAQARDPITLGFSTSRFLLDSAKGGIDLLSNKGAIVIAADRILVGEGAVIDALTGEETQQQLTDLFNKAAATKRESGVLAASTLSLLAGSQLLVQNTGTADARAGITVGSANGLTIGTGETTLFFIVNGKLTDSAGAILAGRDAAKAYLATLKGTEKLAPKSMFNGCELSGCPQIVKNSGEITSTVSAAVTGATNTGSGVSTTGTGSGSKTGSGSSGEESGSENSAGSSSGGSVPAGGSASGGGEVTADNVDDGGGGDEEFVIEEDDASGGDEGGEESDSSDDEDSSEEEESSSEEEDEDSEGPVSGPIAPPPSLINTRGLEPRGVVNDPIAGSGNPALIDPDVEGPRSGSGGDE